MNSKLPPLPEPDIRMHGKKKRTISEASIGAYMTETVERLRHEAVEADRAENLRLAGEVANRNARALEGDKAVAMREKFVDQIERLEAENAKLKTVPMKYRRMEFNAQLQVENAALRRHLAAVMPYAHCAETSSLRPHYDVVISGARAAVGDKP